MNKKFSMRVLSIKPKEGHSVNGVIFQTTEDHLEEFDERENRKAYERVPVNLSEVEFYKDELESDHTDLYIYISRENDINQGGYI